MSTSIINNRRFYDIYSDLAAEFPPNTKYLLRHKYFVVQLNEGIILNVHEAVTIVEVLVHFCEKTTDQESIMRFMVTFSPYSYANGLNTFVPVA